jgi:hypothetical protein
VRVKKIQVGKNRYKLQEMQWYSIMIIKLSAKDLKKEEDDENDQRFDVRVLKGIPDYSDVPEYR